MLSQVLRSGLRHKLQSSQVLVLARSLAVEDFCAREDGKAVLLVRLNADDSELATGLVQRYGADNASSAAVGVLEFKTAMADLNDFRTLSSPRDDAPHFDLEALARWISVAPCFPLSIAKSSTAFAERISVGRAINKDIVLRSKNVSKSHAWFERNAAGQLCIADAGSRNGTTVSGQVLEPRALKPIPDGVDIRIGKLEVTVCSGELFSHLAQVF